MHALTRSVKVMPKRQHNDTKNNFAVSNHRFTLICMNAQFWWKRIGRHAEMTAI